MSSAGWYPDPSGRPGWYRYWTGTAWTESLTTNPQQTAAPTGSPGGTPPLQKPAGRPKAKWWIAAVAAVALIAVIIWGIVTYLPKLTSSADSPWNSPTSSSDTSICPVVPTGSSAVPSVISGSRVTAGHLSFPILSDPWESPEYDNRVPFGTLAVTQTALDQSNYDGEGHSWVSSVLVSDITSGDGFASTKVAAQQILTCVLGTYYSDTTVTQSLVSSKTHSVDGHSGWLIETQLSFSVTGLNATGERVLLLVVEVSDGSYGLFYASVPDTSADRLPDVRQTLADLKVD